MINVKEMISPFPSPQISIIIAEQYCLLEPTQVSMISQQSSSMISENYSSFSAMHFLK